MEFFNAAQICKVTLRGVLVFSRLQLFARGASDLGEFRPNSLYIVGMVGRVYSLPP